MAFFKLTAFSKHDCTSAGGVASALINLMLKFVALKRKDQLSNVTYRIHILYALRTDVCAVEEDCTQLIDEMDLCRDCENTKMRIRRN